MLLLAPAASVCVFILQAGKILSALLRCCRSYIAAVLDILDPMGEIFGQRLIAGQRAQFKTLDKVMLLTVTLAIRSILLHTHSTEVAACCYPTLTSISKYNRDPLCYQLFRHKLSSHSLFCAMQGLEGKEAISLILDDLKVMWPGHQSNLRDVEAYCFFPHDSTNARSAKLGHDKSCRRCTLVHLEKPMRECHRHVFLAVEHIDGPCGPDTKELVHRSWGVPHVLPMMRKEVTDLAYPDNVVGVLTIILQPCCL